jgi:enamine deaminase RidA (YjgF/YER057c/UK114 family)
MIADRRQLLRLSGLTGLAASAPMAHGDAQPAAGMVRKGVLNPDKNPQTGPHAVKLRNISEWLVFAGHSALGRNSEILHPGDALAQLRWIFSSLKHTLEQEGYSLADVVQLKMTCVAEVTLNERVQFLNVFAEFFGHQQVPPMGATMSVVHSLMYPGMLVEVDVWAAR